MAFGGNAGVTQVLMKFTGDASGAISSMKGFDQKFNATMQGMRRYGLATFTAVTGSLTAMAMSTAKLGDHFQKMSMQTGISTETLSAWRFVAEQSGSSVEALEKGVLRMSRGMFEAAQGVGEYADTYKHLGIEVTNADGTMRSAEDVLGDVAERFSQMKDGTEKAALAQELFGRAGAELIPMLNLGRDGIKELTDEADRLGITFSQDAANASAAFNDRLNELKLSFSGIKNEIGMVVIEAVTPYIEKIKESVVQVISWMKENKELVVSLVKLVAIIGGAGGLAAAVGILLPLLTGPAGLIILIGGAAAAAYQAGKAFNQWLDTIQGFNHTLKQQMIDLRAATQGIDSMAESYKRAEESGRDMDAVTRGLVKGYGDHIAAVIDLLDKYENMAFATDAERETLDKLITRTGMTREELLKMRDRLKEAAIETGYMKDNTIDLSDAVVKLTVNLEDNEDQIKDNTEELERMGDAAGDVADDFGDMGEYIGGELEYLGKYNEETTDKIELDWGDSLENITEDTSKSTKSMNESFDDFFKKLTGSMTDWKNKSWKDWLGDIVDLFGWANPHGAIGEMSKNYFGFLDFMSKAGSTWLGADSGLKGFLDNFKKAFGDMLNDIKVTFDGWLKDLGSSLASFMATIGEFFSWFSFFSWLSGLIGGGGPEEPPPGGWDWESWRKYMEGKGRWKPLPVPWYEFFGGAIPPGEGGGVGEGYFGGGDSFQYGGPIPEYIRGIGASGRRYEFHGPGETVVPNKFLGGITVNINYPLLLNRGAIQQVTNAIQRELTNNLANMGLVNFSGAS